MKKLLFFFATIATIALTSCGPQRIIYKESSGRNVEPTQGVVFTPALVADLNILTDKSVSNVVVFKDVVVTTAILGEVENYKKMALFQTIQKYNADLMVASMINVNTTSRGQLEVTVVGYPARYTNFHQINSADTIAIKYTERIISNSQKGEKRAAKDLSLNLFNKKK